jgi:arylsulfatase A-like enzyme
MVGYLDKIIGKIVSKVDQIGQLDNTIILFTADNGTNVRITSRWNGREIQGGKGGTKDMGTHVPLVAFWKGHTPRGVVLEDLIDFTDFYPTLAEAAGVSLGGEDPIDGRSFLPQLKGQRGNPRDWVFCHYQPYWGRFNGAQYVRNEDFKLYRDGTFFHVPEDLMEANDLASGRLGQRGEIAHRELSKVLNIAPPAPPIQGGNKASQRPIHPAWNNILDPVD